jgi:hypothetical protein
MVREMRGNGLTLREIAGKLASDGTGVSRGGQWTRGCAAPPRDWLAGHWSPSAARSSPSALAVAELSCPTEKTGAVTRLSRSLIAHASKVNPRSSVGLISSLAAGDTTVGITPRGRSRPRASANRRTAGAVAPGCSHLAPACCPAGDLDSWGTWVLRILQQETLSRYRLLGWHGLDSPVPGLHQ